MARAIRTLVLVLVVAAMGVVICHTTATMDDNTPAITGRYLLVVDSRDCNLPGVRHSANDTCTEPKYSRVHLLQSDDGASWRPVPGFETYPATCPTLFVGATRSTFTLTS